MYRAIHSANPAFDSKRRGRLPMRNDLASSISAGGGRFRGHGADLADHFEDRRGQGFRP